MNRTEAERGATATGMLRLGLGVFFAMNVMVFAMALWSQDVYPPEAFATPLAETLRGVFRWAALVFALPVLYLLGEPIAAGVWQSLRRRAVTTDLLILLGVCAAYGYSVVSVLRGEGHVYFEVSSMVLVFVSLGRWLEAHGKLRTNESLDALASLLPETVRRRSAGGTFADMPRHEVAVGDVLRVLPGERLPVDGVIASGRALVDEQMVTGESRPVERSAGEPVFSGTLNLDGDLRIEVTAADGEETVSRILNLVRAARQAKGRHQRLADRIAVWFIPTVFAIAIAAAWWHGRRDGWDEGILTGLAVVLIACPCALGLATPLAVWTALGRAAQGGVLFRSGESLERLAGIRHACFDKTGTLTTGAAAATALVTPDGADRQQVLALAEQLGRGSTHPLSRAVVRFAGNASDSDAIAVDTIAGCGLSADLPQVGRVLMGSPRWLADEGFAVPTEVASALDGDWQAVAIGWAGRVQGVFEFREELRPEAADALRACRDLGLDLRMLTGDERSRAAAIGARLALPTDFAQLPAAKAETLASLSREGGVAMVGDGLNDAPALAAADVGVALGCGADVSRDAAEVCLLADDLQRFPWAVGLARQTVRVVKQNLFWAFAYNIGGIALAATGNLNPLWAAGAMAVSSAFVISNSLRLGRYAEVEGQESRVEGQKARCSGSVPATSQAHVSKFPSQLELAPLAQ